MLKDAARFLWQDRNISGYSIQNFDDYIDSLKAAEQIGDEGHQYEFYHRERFAYVIRQCLRVSSDSTVDVLDIGRSALSLKLLQHYASVSTLGFALGDAEAFGHERGSGLDASHAFGGHIVYDLNDAQAFTGVPTDKRFDLIVFAEVLEHLYTAPELTVYALSWLLKPGGHLIVQTPNATALHKRVRLLAGRHPYERIRINNRNPGHYREYTRSELVRIADTVGLTVVDHEYCDYFGVSGGPLRVAGLRLLKACAAAVPSLSRGQTIILRKPTDSGGGA